MCGKREGKGKRKRKRMLEKEKGRDRKGEGAILMTEMVFGELWVREGKERN